MISYDVEISIAGGGADEKDDGKAGFVFFFFFLFSFCSFFSKNHIFVVHVQEIALSASYGENKTQKPKQN